MDWIELFKVLGITSAGPVFLIIILGFFGKKLMESYFKETIETKRAELNQQLEDYKNQLDMIKQVTMRYSDKQFEYYNKLWLSLFELKLCADNLWERADFKNLKKFSTQLQKTKSEIEKSALFIEEKHYEELYEVISYFSEYEIGKMKLIDYRESSQNYLNVEDIMTMTNRNREYKEKYESLISEIKKDLKEQIKGIE